MIGNISKSKGFKGDKGDAFAYEDFTPEQLESLVGAQGKKGDTPNIKFTYNKATGDLYYSSDGVLVGESYISSENLATKDDVAKHVADGIDKISDNLIVDVEPSGILKVYDKYGKPTTEWEEVYCGIFRTNDASNQEYSNLFYQTKYPKIGTEERYICQVIFLTNETYRIREIKDLSATSYPYFRVVDLRPYDKLDGDTIVWKALSANQGYILDQKKADKEEVSAAKDEILSTMSNVLSTKENISNKSTVIDDSSNDILYPSAKAVKAYVDSNVSNINSKLIIKADRSEIDKLKDDFEAKSNKVTAIDETANNSKYPTTKATKDYADDINSKLTTLINKKADAYDVYEINKTLNTMRSWFLDTEVESNKVKVIDETADHYTYPSAKAVKDYVDSIVEECIQRIMNESSAIRTVTLNLYASQWLENEGLYSQIVTINNVTPYSKIDLQPTAEQLTIFHEKDVTFVTENDNGVITVYCIGQKPTNDYIMQATITEVKKDG